MELRANEKELNEIGATNVLPQTEFWGRVKYEDGYIPYTFSIKIPQNIIDPYEDSSICVEEDLLVFIKYYDNEYCFAYVPYGPKIQPKFENYGFFLEELSEVLRAYLPKNCIFIRYDLLWENQWAYEESCYYDNNEWKGTPDSSTQEFRINFNTTNWNLYKSNTDILPKNTFFLNLEDNESRLLKKMRYNTRYNIKKADRKGVVVKECGIDMIDEWYKLYGETVLRNNMVLNDKDYFINMMKKKDENVKVSLLMAQHDNDYLASMFLVYSNERANYLFGASSSNNKQLLGSYKLQWEAIKKAKDDGCKEYDMFGCAPNLNKSHPLHGVHVYKKGFGGQIFHRMGCWDYAIMAKEYEIIKAKEMNIRA